MNETIQTIMKRCSIRSYKDTPVSDEHLDIILRAAMAAPSATNKQPWEFVVVNQREQLDNLARGLIFAKSLKQAPLAVVVCGNSKSFVPIGKEFWVEDCSAATQNILLACTSLGLGSLWIGVHPVDMFKKHLVKCLDLPNNIIPLGIVAIGYADKEGKVLDKYNPNKIKYNKYK